MTDELDAETLAFAHRMFDLARDGETSDLVANIAGGLPVNLTNDKGDTLLILAAYHDHPDTVAALLAAGADHARINDRGQTALASAVFRRSNATIEMLLKAGADPKLGSPSSIDVARFFELPEQLAMLEDG